MIAGHLIDHALGSPITLWRLRAPDGSGELVCLIGQERPTTCVFRLQFDGRPVAIPERIRRLVLRRSNALRAAVDTAEQWRRCLVEWGWIDVEEKE